jgi:hypothetical protein
MMSETMPLLLLRVKSNCAPNQSDFWNPYGPGFADLFGARVNVNCQAMLALHSKAA